MIVLFGVGSYFKRNRESVHDVCENCGHTGWKRCYDTTRCFWLYGIPVLPVGQKHVFNECPKCRQGGMAPLRDWREGRERQLPVTIERLEQDPSDREAAAEALEQVVRYHHHDAFVNVAVLIEQAFADDAGMIGDLAGGYAYFGMYDEAEAAYRTALDLSDEPETRAALAWYLASVGKLDEAVTAAEPLVASPTPGAAGVLLALGEALHERGDHESALSLLDAAREAAPELDQGKAFGKFYKKVRKRAARAGSPIPGGKG